eukprot:327054-Chlamydomonas_euryale.AAC.4
MLQLGLDASAWSIWMPIRAAACMLSSACNALVDIACICLKTAVFLLPSLSAVARRGCDPSVVPMSRTTRQGFMVPGLLRPLPFCLHVVTGTGTDTGIAALFSTSSHLSGRPICGRGMGRPRQLRLARGLWVASRCPNAEP